MQVSLLWCVHTLLWPNVWQPRHFLFWFFFFIVEIGWQGHISMYYKRCGTLAAAFLATLCPTALWNARNPDMVGREGRREGDSYHLCVEARGGHIHTNCRKALDPSLVVYRADRGSVQQFQPCWWPRCLQLGSPAHFSSVGCSSDWQASKAGRKLGTWRDNSAFLWSAACLEARPLLGEVMRLPELDQMAIWD